MKTKFLIPLAGLVLFCACKNKNDYELNRTSSADTLAKDIADTIQAKLVKTAAIDFKVKNVQQTATRVTALTEGFGGMVTHQQIGASPERTQDIRVSRDSVMRVISFSTAADITVKVPSINLEKFMDSVTTMGIYVTSRNLDISDKSLDYLSLRLKLKSRVELVDRQKRESLLLKTLPRCWTCRMIWSISKLVTGTLMKRLKTAWSPYIFTKVIPLIRN